MALVVYLESCTHNVIFMPTEKIASLSHSKPQRRSRLLGIGVGVMLSFLLLAAVSTAYFSGIFVSASNDSPSELIIRNVTDNSAELYWATQDETQGLIQYGTNPSELTLIAPEVTAGKEHIQVLTLLQPSTTYYFRIKIGEKEFDNGGVPWTFGTKESGASAAPTKNEDVQTEPQPVNPTQEAVQAPPVAIPTASATGNCPSTTNCETIKNLLGQGCSTSDYIMCLQKK